MGRASWCRTTRQAAGPDTGRWAAPWTVAKRAEDAVVREIQEEFGAEIQNVRLLGC